MSYSSGYVRLVNALHAALASNTKWVKPPAWQQDPWREFLDHNPDAIYTVKAVEHREGEETTYAQRCLAVSRLLQAMT